jgi:hypothetical protein
VVGPGRLRLSGAFAVYLAAEKGLYSGMSRAFINEDAGTGEAPRYPLPARDDPSFDLAATRALLHGADLGDTASAESATGYYLGEPKLRPLVQRLLDEAQEDGNERLEQLAGRFLRVAERQRPGNR